MKPIYDIRQQMPQFAANFFPPVNPDIKYPKMMVNPETKKPYLDGTKKPVVVEDEHEEKLFLAKHYKPDGSAEQKIVEVDVAAAKAPEPIVAHVAEAAAKRGPGRPAMPKNLSA